MPSTYRAFLGLLEDSTLAEGIRRSLWLYPIMEIIHIVGIVLLVGAAVMFDLRLLGFSQSLPLRALSQHLLPWSQRGLLLIIPSGILLFMTNAASLGLDPTFWLKMILLVVAGLNVFIFHRFIFRGDAGEVRSGGFGKVSALVSIVVWIAVIACGRLLAY